MNKALTYLKISLFVTLILIFILNLLPSRTLIVHEISEPPSLLEPQFQKAMSRLLSAPLTEGNTIQVFNNGVEIFPAMLKAIREAKKSITFEAYIYWSDHVGQEFIEALSDRARAGVKVHVLVDWLGSRKLEDEYQEKLKKAGVELEIYRRPSLNNLTEMNQRTHRRILVIDGRVGFTGGVGICDDWDGNADSPDKWRDSQFRVEGPAVALLQSAFMDNWLKLRPTIHIDENYFPMLSPQGPSSVQVFKSSNEEGSETVHLMFQLAIASAKKNIYLESAYFMPDDFFVGELIKARKNGVRIQIILPGPHTDSPLVQKASKTKWKKLIEAGVEIYEYQPSRFHCKVLIVDDFFVSVGSTNFDNRSFRLNDEANINIYDSNFAQREIEIFERDKKVSDLVTLDRIENRSWFEKLTDETAALLQSQL